MELATQRQFALKRAVAIAVLFVGAVGARIFWISQMRALWGDEPLYTWLSGNFLSTQSPLDNISPLFPSLATLVAQVLGWLGMSSHAAFGLGSALMYILFGGLLVAPVYGVARRMGGEGIAAGAGLATVVYPVSVGGLPRPGAMAEPLYLLLVATAWYFLLLAVDERTPWATVLGGVFVGLAFLTRPEGLLYLLFALGLLLIATWLSRKDDYAPRHVAVHVGIALMVFSLVAGPYLPALTQVRL